MSQDLITRYRKSFRLRFDNADVEDRYRERPPRESRASNLVAFGALAVLTVTFAFLEFRAFGHDVSTPMYGYLGAATFALFNLLLGQLGITAQLLSLRILVGAALAFAGLIAAVYLQKYSAYHALEFVLLALWLGSTQALRTLALFVIIAMFAAGFVVAMYASGVSPFWLMLVSAILAVSVFLATCTAYAMERGKRLLFLQSAVNRSVVNRQELWAFALIDLDMSLSGVLNLRELIRLLIKHLEPVVEFDSYVNTVLEGQGPRPTADKVEGELFENEDRTIWSEELLGKLNQTRQATVSAEHEEEQGLFGTSKKRFISYRLDVPIFNDSKLLGVISLRRASEPFDDLDMTASVSIASQATLIYRRSRRLPPAAEAKSDQSPEKTEEPQRNQADETANQPTSGTAVDNRDLEVTDSNFNVNGTLVPAGVRDKLKQDEENVKRTITLMSRENAEKIAVDHYRTATVEGDPLSILIVEVDGLSKLREKDGDQVAYRVFAAIVKYIFAKVDKEKDVLGRYGQNGLSIVMPNIDMNAAERFAESLRAHVADTRYKTAYGERTATLSIGVASITDETGEYAAMVRRADMALFVAKKNGRNCVKVRL